MSDPLLFLPTLGGGLSPADDRTRDAVRALKKGAVVAVDLKQPRNGKMHRLFYALMTLVHQNLREDKERLYPTVDALVDAVKIHTGWRDEIHMPSGAVHFKPRSIAFHKMDQAQFDAFFQAVCTLVTTHFLPGVTDTDLASELRQMVGLEKAA